MAARSALECFLQLAGEFVGRGLYRVLHDLSGQGERLVYSCFDGGLANRDEPGMVSSEVLSRLVEFPAGQRPAAEPLGDDAEVRAVHPLENVWPAVLLVDHGRVELADHSRLVQPLDGVQVR
jgi:hypothetical protein